MMGPALFELYSTSYSTPAKHITSTKSSTRESQHQQQQHHLDPNQGGKTKLSRTSSLKSTSSTTTSTEITTSTRGLSPSKQIFVRKNFLSILFYAHIYCAREEIVLFHTYLMLVVDVVIFKSVDD